MTFSKASKLLFYVLIEQVFIFSPYFLPDIILGFLACGTTVSPTSYTLRLSHANVTDYRKLQIRIWSCLQ
jgi:hypothetical protein